MLYNVRNLWRWSKKGFTLIELLAVMTIITVLSALLLPALQIARGKAKHARWLGAKHSIELDPDCLLYYTFEEGSGETVKNWAGTASSEISFDSSDLNGTVEDTQGQGGTAFSGADWSSTGRFPGRNALNGGEDAYIYVGDIDTAKWANKPVNKELTIMAWCKPASEDLSTFHWVVSRCYGSVMRGFWLGIHTWSPNRFDFIVGNTDGTYTGATSTTAAVPGNWYHIAGTFSYAAGRKVKLYVNGKQEGGTATLASGDLTPIGEGQSISDPGTTRSGMFFLGIGKRSMYKWDLGVDYAQHWEGLIGEVAIFKRALSAEEINQYYRGSRP